MAVVLFHFVSPAIADDDHESLRSELLTLQGEVLELGTALGEGSLLLVTVTLRPKTQETTGPRLLLAPAEVLETVGFQVREGDEVRARVFSDPSGSHLAHKVWNLNSHREIRLRTLRRAPVWNNEGEWQGGHDPDCPYRPWKQEDEPASASDHHRGPSPGHGPSDGS